MQTKQELQNALEHLTNEQGSWFYDIPLPFGVWTNGNQNIPHTRLRRIVQIVSDHLNKPMSDCRVLDLGCLEGIFSIEFAMHGAKVVGVEIRDANIKKAVFCQQALELENLEFRQDDVRNVSRESYGEFDAIVCSGILYHLLAKDAIELINRMQQMAKSVVVIDTHIALVPEVKTKYEEEVYSGRVFREHPRNASDKDKANSRWASADNVSSFWFTRPSLVNIITRAGFSSVYECFSPAHLNYGKPGLEHRDRCTFVAINNNAVKIRTSPSVNDCTEMWPEKSLSFAPESTFKGIVLNYFSRAKSRLKIALGK